MTLEELVLCIVEGIEKKKEVESKNEVVIKEETSNDEIYTIEQLINNYSFFTRYSLNKTIEEDGLPYFKIGSKKYFKKREIDKWIADKQKSDSNKRGF